MSMSNLPANVVMPRGYNDVWAEITLMPTGYVQLRYRTHDRQPVEEWGELLLDPDTARCLLKDGVVPAAEIRGDDPPTEKKDVYTPVHNANGESKLMKICPDGKRFLRDSSGEWREV